MIGVREGFFTERRIVMNLYDFTMTDNKGTQIPLSTYAGKVLLIVNTATKCGLTPQYDALEALYQKYRDRGLDFPCNQFLEQASGTDEEINSFCTLTYNTTFPRFQKLEVNGPGAHPLYVWLKQQAPMDRRNDAADAFEAKVGPLVHRDGPHEILWNFCKFLITKQGDVFARYSPAFTPRELEGDIERLLEK